MSIDYRLKRQRLITDRYRKAGSWEAGAVVFLLLEALMLLTFAEKAASLPSSCLMLDYSRRESKTVIREN